MSAEAGSPDVSVVISFHREGLLAHKSLLSLGRCRVAAAQAGLLIEVIATLDHPDEETERVLRVHDGEGRPDLLLSPNVGDLGESRNHAIRAASGRWILVCDGDDYLSENFIVRCVEASKAAGPDTILHADLIVLFEGWNAISRQTGDDDPAFDSDCMLVCNPWNSCSFAPREVYAAVPYVRARPGETGFGFEDWHWNCETLARGYAHRIADRTVHYVRRKVQGSLNQAHAAHEALIPPTTLFGVGQ